MKIPGIEPIQLNLPLKRQRSEDWLLKKVKNSHRVLELNEFNHWVSTGNLMTGHINYPFSLPHKDGSFDRVILKYTLNYVREIEKKRNIIEECKRVLAPTGFILSLSRACDSGLELAELIVRSGVPPDKLNISNLGNKTIVMLKPRNAEFLSNFLLIHEKQTKDKNVLRDFIKEVLKKQVIPYMTDEQLDSMSCELRVKLLDIGLIWTKFEEN